MHICHLQLSTSSSTMQGNFIQPTILWWPALRSSWAQNQPIYQASGMSNAPSHSFSIRGDYLNSFCLPTLLPLEEYTTMLKASILVSTKHKKLGRYIFVTSKDVWNNFLQVYGLLEWDQVGITETIQAKRKIQTLKKVSQGECKDPKNGWVLLVCIGMCDTGEIVTPSLWFTEGIVLPDISHHQIQAQCALKIAIKFHINRNLLEQNSQAPDIDWYWRSQKKPLLIPTKGWYHQKQFHFLI